VAQDKGRASGNHHEALHRVRASLQRRRGQGLFPANGHKRNPGKREAVLSNIRAEDVAGAVDHLSYLDSAVGQAYNIAEDYNPSIEEALGLAAKAFGMKMPGLHLPLWLVKLAAKIDGAKAARKGRIPDLEYDAVKYLYHDYVVDNSKLKAAGYAMLYPDFRESMKQMGDWYRARK